VHLTRYPSLRTEGEAIQSPAQTGSPRALTSARDDEILTQMDFVRDVCNAALAIRNKLNIRVRQPLASVTIAGANILAKQDEDFFFSVICDELNVKQVLVGGGEQDLKRFADFKLQIHFPILGKRLPDKIKQIIPASKKGDWKQLPDGRIAIAGETLEPTEFAVLLDPKSDYKDKAQPLSTNDALVILDTAITPELEAEGFARDLIRLIQQARKDAGLQVTDRIHLRLTLSARITAAVHAHESYILAQVLGESLVMGDMQGCQFVANETIENEAVSIGILKQAAAA
jgi:isoleucyl-tRNA synthetase